jgi:hypothetical protein
MEGKKVKLECKEINGETKVVITVPGVSERFVEQAKQMGFSDEDVVRWLLKL